MKQDEAFDLLKLGENIFLTGAAGAGKTYLLNAYINYLRQHGVGVAMTASTGIAATHINGKTLHSWSGIGVRDKLTDDELGKLLRNKRLRRNYANVKVLVIDEISMLHPYQLDLVDRIARGMLDGGRPFGGLQVILCGDFFQLPPVMSMDGRYAGAPGGRAPVERRDLRTSRRFAFYANAWQSGEFRICYLHEQHRQGDDPLLTILNDIRAGRVGEHSKVPLRTRYKREPEGCTRATRLYARNVNVDHINDGELARLDGAEKRFTMETQGFAALVDGLKKSCLAPEVLRLKTGAEVMFIKNAVDGAYVNGTRGRVEEFDEEEGWPVVRTFDGDRVVAAPAEWKQEDNGLVRATLIQVPLRLAWAITIHKSQGMTLDAAEIDLSDAFEPGMGYVALSRVRNLGGLKLMGLNDTALQVNTDVSMQDAAFHRQSTEAEAYLRSLAGNERRTRQREVLLKRFKGSLKKTGFPKEANKPREKKPPTHEATLAMLENKTQLTDIARQRRLTPATILSHLEKLKGRNALPDIAYLKPAMPGDEFERVIQAFRESEDGRLSPIHEKFGGRYSFEDLRIARLFA